MLPEEITEEYKYIRYQVTIVFIQDNVIKNMHSFIQICKTAAQFCLHEALSFGMQCRKTYHTFLKIYTKLLFQHLFPLLSNVHVRRHQLTFLTGSTIADHAAKLSVVVLMLWFFIFALTVLLCWSLTYSLTSWSFL